MSLPLTLVLFVRSTAPEYAEDRTSALIWLTFTLLSGAFGYLFLRLADHCGRMVRALAYVPPVAEQVSALPAKKILVRGSGALAALPNELLRANQPGPRAPEDLLRATDDKIV